MRHSTEHSGRAERTRARLAASALALFERYGYEETTTAQIATAAGVSEMTLFRHFPAKERLVTEDPYDPIIAEAVSAQSASLPPLARIVAGIRAAWASVPEPETGDVRRRIRIAARTPSLAAAMHANTRATEDAIVDALVADGTGTAPARIAAAATLAALMAALLEWADSERGTLADGIAGALDVLEGGSP